MADISDDARAAADTLLPLIKRVSPGSLEKAELLEQAGMEAAEVREGLAVLIDEKKIVEGEDGYAMAGKAARTASKVEKDEEGDSEEKEAPEGADPAAPPSAPGGQSYRATFEVTVTYGGPAKDEAAMQMAAGMEEQIADEIHGLYPKGVVAVDCTKVEAYRPRVIYGEGAESE